MAARWSDGGMISRGQKNPPTIASTMSAVERAW